MTFRDRLLGLDEDKNRSAIRNCSWVSEAGYIVLNQPEKSQTIALTLWGLYKETPDPD